MERKHTLFLCAAFALAPALAQDFPTVTAEEAAAQVGASLQATRATSYIWSERYLYRSGQSLTLRWTLKPNGDDGPYTIFAYRQNNQTGQKLYLPGHTETLTDIFGRTADQGYRIIRLTEFAKRVAAGPGGLAPAVPIPNELGMHTLVLEIRDYTGGRVLKGCYQKIGVIDEEVNVTGTIETNTLWTNTKAYRIRGIVQIRNGATLTLEPGTLVIGEPGSQPPSVLVATRSGRIIANGTRSRPIIMTSSQPFGQRKRGDWGGLIMLGQAPVNWPAGFGNIEGLPDTDDTRYGGTNPDHLCGFLRYVRVEFAGSELRPNEETNSFTWGGCGTATVSEYLQAHYGLDDAFEWFGGNNNAKYLVGTYTADDFFDWQIGYTGKVQHAVAVANDDRSNRGFEGDNNERDFTLSPFSNPQFFNVTLVGGGDQHFDEPGGAHGIFVRRGTRASINNVVSTNFYDWGIQASDQATLDNIANRTLTTNGVILWNNGRTQSRPNTVAGQAHSSFVPCINGTAGQCRQTVIADPQLRRPFDYSDPDFRPQPGSPVYRANWVNAPDDGFFDQWAKWSGAFGDIDWTEEWTNFLQEQDIAQ